MSLLIDIQNSIKAQESRGYEQWAKIHNLKQAAKTLNFLTENKIKQYADLTVKIAEIGAASEQAADALKGAEKRLAEIKSFSPRNLQYMNQFDRLYSDVEITHQLMHKF